MLWTDGDFITADDLITLDAEVKDVAAAEEITLEDPSGNGVIHRAIEESGDRLMKYLQVFGGYINSGTVSANHYAAVMNVGLPSVNRSKILITQIVVSSLNPMVWSQLKRWVAYWTLQCFFRDAANRTVKERYQTKQERYHKLANTEYWDAIRSTGVPIVRTPCPCPGALFEPAAGIWGKGNVNMVAGPGTSMNAFDVIITWVDTTGGKYQSPANPNQGESAGSAAQNVQATAGNVIQVNLTGLNPPNGSQPAGTMPFAVVPFCKAVGWNLYIGPTGGPWFLQNTTGPIPISQTVFTLPGDPVQSGPTLGVGQYADLYLSLPMGMVQRG